MKPKCFLFGMLGGVALIALLLLVFGVRFTSDVMAYDPAKEITTKGTVVAVEDFACPASEGEIGSHLLLKTDAGEYEVHLAPSRVMRSLNWKFQPGQQVEVVGAQVRLRGKEGLMARQIRWNDEIFTFRDPQGLLLVKQQ
jgi:uncharacterized membrane protein